ncbi:hypothetical protein DFP73DRAFT_592862 [Morchella snyderi]|nr:hypothetical protein DFP73DRAFT_592862 [Morchella snyderi]
MPAPEVNDARMLSSGVEAVVRFSMLCQTITSRKHNPQISSPQAVRANSLIGNPGNPSHMPSLGRSLASTRIMGYHSAALHAAAGVFKIIFNMRDHVTHKQQTNSYSISNLPTPLHQDPLLHPTLPMKKVKPGRKAKPKSFIQNISEPPTPESKRMQEKTPAKKGRIGTAKLKIEKGDQAHLAKSKEKTTNQLAEHLKDHLLGTYRMSSSCLNFHWKGENSDQRRVKENHVANIVQNFQDEGLKRPLPVGCVSPVVGGQSWEEDSSTPSLILPAGITTQGKEHLRDNNQDLHLVPLLAENWVSIISYQRNNNDLQVSRTLATTGKSGPKLKQLLGYEHLRDPITPVLRNRGHWPQFTTSRLSRLLPLRRHEELSNYLRRIDITWEFIGGELGEGFLKVIDGGTVKAVEGRAPGGFIEDAQFVVDNMEHRLFFKVTNQEDRNKILQRLLQIDYRILSLHTFWEDKKHLETFSRVMTDTGSWLDPLFSSSKASFKQTFARYLNLEKKYGSKTYPQFWISHNSLRERKNCEMKRRYHSQTYTDIWAYIFKNLYALYIVYPKSYAPDVPREEWATSSPLLIVPGMKDEQVELYNNRFAILEWGFLYNTMEKIGYDFEESSSMGIGPKHLKLPPRDESTAESRAKDFQHKIFKEALERTRPYLGKELSTAVLTNMLNTLPPITDEDLNDFSLRAPKTEAPLERFGGIPHVWTPGFTECNDMLERSIIYRNIPSYTNKPPIEKDQVSMNLFVKRDIIWSYFQHPVRDDGEDGEGCPMDAYGYDSCADKGDEDSFNVESGDLVLWGAWMMMIIMIMRMMMMTMMMMMMMEISPTAWTSTTVESNMHHRVDASRCHMQKPLPGDLR